MPVKSHSQLCVHLVCHPIQPLTTPVNSCRNKVSTCRLFLNWVRTSRQKFRRRLRSLRLFSAIMPQSWFHRILKDELDRVKSRERINFSLSLNLQEPCNRQNLRLSLSHQSSQKHAPNQLNKEQLSTFKKN
jgi:hypothetical protein